MPVPETPVALRHVRTPDGRRLDLELRTGRISRVLPAGTLSDSPGTLDLGGHLLLPAGAEPHAHLDKAYSYDRIRPRHGDLLTAIDSWCAYRQQMSEADVVGRARRAVEALLANGTTAVRSHVDLLDGPDPLLGVRALVRVREEVAGLLDIQLAALGTDRTPSRVYEAALDAGVDLIGGAPHLAAAPLPEVRRLVGLARRRGVGIDLHTDESLDGVDTLDTYASLVAGWPPHTVSTSAGHCVRLGMMAPADRRPVIEKVVRAGIGIITLPITNLYLQGWDQQVAVPRGLTAVADLVEAGAIVGAGADNVRDPFNPLGRSDFLETAMLLVAAAHVSIPTAVDLATNGGRRVMGLEPVTFEPGSPADFVAVAGDSLEDVVAEAPGDRLTIRAGTVVARRRTEVSIATPTIPDRAASHLSRTPLAI